MSPKDFAHGVQKSTVVFFPLRRCQDVKNRPSSFQFFFGGNKAGSVPLVRVSQMSPGFLPCFCWSTVQHQARFACDIPGFSSDSNLCMSMSMYRGREAKTLRTIQINIIACMPNVCCQCLVDVAQSLQPVSVGDYPCCISHLVKTAHFLLLLIQYHTISISIDGKKQLLLG